MWDSGFRARLKKGPMSILAQAESSVLRPITVLCGDVSYYILLLGGPFDLVSRVSKVAMGDYNRVSKGY